MFSLLSVYLFAYEQDYSKSWLAIKFWDRSHSRPGFMIIFKIFQHGNMIGRFETLNKITQKVMDECS